MSAMKVSDLKTHLSDQFGWPYESMRVIYSDRAFQDHEYCDPSVTYYVAIVPQVKR